MGFGPLSKLSVATGLLDLDVKKFLFRMFQVDTVTALGTTQADAAPLTAGKNVVLAADGTVGVMLPKAIDGAKCEVVNTVAAQTLKVYAYTGEVINAIGTTAAYSLTGGSATTFHCDANAHWYVPVTNITGTTTTSTSAELNTLHNVTAGTVAASSAVVVDANKRIDTLVIADGGLKLGTAGGTAVGATALEINNAADTSANTEIVTSTNVIAATESGMTYYLNSATEFVSTLPAPAQGLKFSFIVTAAPSGANYTVVTNASANIIVGQQHSAAGDAGDFGTTDDTINFVDGQAVAGDRVDVFCDGTNWFAYAYSKLAAGITFTTAS